MNLLTLALDLHIAGSNSEQAFEFLVVALSDGFVK
jgi:hypothetical protein